MKSLGILLFFLIGHCVADEPTHELCVRLSEIIGDFLEWYQRDYISYTGGNARGYIKEMNKIITGLDITSANDRVRVLCRIFETTTLKGLYDLIASKVPLEYLGPYTQTCQIYEHVQSEPVLDLALIQKVHRVAEELAIWMRNSGFPERFPPRTSHDVNVESLEKIAAMVDPNDRNERIMVGDLVTVLLPIKPIFGWKSAPNSTVEIVVNWMEGSSNIYTYVGKIYNAYTASGQFGYAVDKLKENYDQLMLLRYNYDKFSWYEEALSIVLDSNLVRLDTSDCSYE